MIKNAHCLLSILIRPALDDYFNEQIRQQKCEQPLANSSKGRPQNEGAVKWPNFVQLGFN